MTSRIIALFNLKPGQSAADYEDWARTTDLPTVNALPSIAAFEVYRTTGLLGAPGNAPYDYIEIIDIADGEQFDRDIATDAMQAISAHFASIADVTFITTERL